MTAPSHIAHPTMVPPPSPGDWPEDAVNENGRYLCRCVTCKLTFTGHKRRVTCKVCAQRGEVENDYRANLLNGAGLSSEEWALVTTQEQARDHARYANLLLEVIVERNLRRDLAAAFTRLAGCIDSTRGAYAHYALEDGREVAAKSAALDAEIAAREEKQDEKAAV